MDRSRKLNRKSSFFKVLLEDFGTKLQIPPAFVKSFGTGESLRRRAILRTQNRSWEVTIKKTSEGGNGNQCSLYFQGHGWAEFVKGNRLKKADFLVFFFRGGSAFDVLMFGKTSCLKKLKRRNPSSRGNGIPKSANREGGDGCSSSTPLPTEKAKSAHFEVTLDRFNSVFVPADFAAETGLRRRNTVVVKDWEGREWPVKVGGESGGGVLLGDGWADFVNQNGLQLGTTCLIQSVVEDCNVLGVIWLIGDNGKVNSSWEFGNHFLVLLAEIRKDFLFLKD